jgi:lysophospholipase L1-like esterase
MYGAATDNPKDHAFYKELGPTQIPPDSILKNPKLYFDHSHLNQAGAKALAPWLAAQIAQLSHQ